MKSALEITLEITQNMELSETHVTFLQLWPSKATTIGLENEPNPLAFDTKAAIWEFEHKFVSLNMQDEEFKSEVFKNGNRLPTFGSWNDARNAVCCELIAAIEVVNTSRAPSPQPDLHESDIELLETEMDKMDAELPELKSFILPI